MSGYKGFTFDDGDNHVGKKGSRWKGETDQTYRFSFVMWPGLDDGKPDLDAAGPDFRGTMAHYVDKVGYVVNKGPEFTKLTGKPPRSRIGTAVVVWPTNKDGSLDTNKVQNGDCDVMAWLFSDEKYKSLKMIHKEFHLGQHDLTVICSDTKYQKLTFNPCKENLFRRFLESSKDQGKEIAKTIMKNAQEVAENLDNEVGRDLTLEQLVQAMKGQSPGAVGVGATGSPDMAVTGDIDDLIGDILDD